MGLSAVNPGFGQERFGFRERDAKGFVAGWELECARVRVAGFLDDSGELLGVLLRLETADDVDHEVFAKGEDFVVVVSDGHFKVETSELRTLISP